ncbi:laminin EGF domain-containing protein [Ditylenchus destructor]|nr:laminin EGF domain-containing protein [Ditylenchus destructor]
MTVSPCGGLFRRWRTRIRSMLGYGTITQLYACTSLCILLLALCQSSEAAHAMAAEEEDLCTDRSCYPATGNLLIGRKHKLSATSTCGLRGVQQYCIVSHLEDKRKCFRCDSHAPWNQITESGKNSHRIENVVSENYDDRTRNWWQSENGIQNVSIQFDLEAEFHFTHLIMTFRSFRPAAMIIERSSDYGKTWSIYRYFAYDCSTSFSGIPEGPPKNHSDVICTRKYSDVAPSTGGELVYKVISPHIPTEDPYSKEISNLLKITNLRINFTKLHTLGDDLLDYRPEIDEKYYYAVYELVIRGSCSCYGHAQRCIPKGDEVAVETLPDMVYGQCECTHNTMGSNCDKCQPFFNDVGWKAAMGDQPNECRRCECNNHATRCHFDEAVYKASGYVSGGVCDDCMHNTQGKNCEQCKPYYYRDPQRPIHDPYVCRPCECNKAGSVNEGICEGEQDASRDLVAGKCYCKENVDGINCDRCKNGFWDLREEDSLGCRPCTCNLQGTINNEGCNKNDGTCSCKRLVTGENCDQCLPEHYWVTDDPNGCKPCECNPGTSYDNHCSMDKGECRCKTGFTGRRCDKPLNDHFCANIDDKTVEAETATINGAETVLRETPREGLPTWTGSGLVEIKEGSNITFAVEDLPKSMQYNIVIRYELKEPSLGWEDIQVSIVRPGDPSPEGPCANINPSDDFLIARLYPNYRYSEVFPSVCLEAGVRYEVRLYFGERRAGHPDYRAQALIDSIVVAPQTDSLGVFTGSPDKLYFKQQYDRHQCRAQALTVGQNLSHECSKYVCTIVALIWTHPIICDCDPTGSVSSICQEIGGRCDCKPNVVGRKCDKCAVGTYGFGPKGCSVCDCDSVGSLHNDCDKHSGQCVCRERGITGRQCNQCQPGFWGFPDCRTCQCNGHASICDQKTGACIDCRNLTDGAHCETCKAGYYGDPRLAYNLPCKPCPCPGGPGSGFQHADTCYLHPGSSDVVCNCRSGYTGERCDQCQVNYWGNPREIGGSCEKCDCNDNIDRTAPESCDSRTGDCLKCLYNSEGPQCEHCMEGFYGDAKIRTCQRCVCNHLGANLNAGQCDRVTGQCPCYPNVVGAQCDECAPLHFDLASGKGCSACSCDTNGVIIDQNGLPYLECNNIDGHCHCKQGRGGRTCSECQDFYWGDPVNGECRRCECDPTGSATLQCNRQDGTCVCRPGSGGPLCNQCARGYTGQWPHCQACGECFNNWDRILQELKRELDELIDRANNIEDTGVSSQYDESFEAMEKQIAEVKKQLEGVNITKDDVDTLKKQMESLQTQIDSSREKLAEKNQRVTRVSTDVDLAAEGIRSLNETARTLTQLADQLSKNATEIRRSDVKGAYDIVKEAGSKSSDYQRVSSMEVAKIGASESDRSKAEQLLNEHQDDFNVNYEENQAKLTSLSTTISDMHSTIPFLNKAVCGAESDTCDAMCGGPSSKCSHCGGSSCGGSVTKAKQAEEFVREAEEKLQAKQKEGEELLQRIRETSPDIEATRRDSDEAFRIAKAESDKANQTKSDLEKQIKLTKDFLEAEHARPEDIQAKVDQILNVSIPFTQEQIKELAENIRQKVVDIKDTDKILEETSGNKTIATNLQRAAERASERAARIHNVTTAIKEALENAEEAQTAAQAALDQIKANIEKTKSSLGGTEEEVKELEAKATETANKIKEMHNTTDNLKAEYIKITSNSKTATSSANTATETVKSVEQKHENLKETYQKVLKLLEDRESGNDDRKSRAEDLRRRTTELLAKIKRSREEKNSLIERADSLDVELASFRTSVESLSEQIDQVSAEIDRRVEYHSTCDA